MINKRTVIARFSAADIAALLHSHPLFEDTDLDALTKIISRGQILMLGQGDVLLRQGEASDAAYILIEGSASVCLEASYGKVNLTTVSAPTLVGEIGAFTGVARTATIEAATPLCVLRIEIGDLQQFGSENPRF